MNHQTDRELLELAARASGFGGPEHKFCWTENEYPRCSGTHGALWNYVGFMDSAVLWNPLTDDGDALRLVVKLGLSVEPYPIYQPEKHSVSVKQRRQSDTMREANPTQVIELYGGDPYAAARRAITRAAAEVAKAGG